MLTSVGGGFEAGWLFDHSGKFQQFLGVGAEGNLMSIGGLGYLWWVGAGPKYGFKWRGFHTSLGVGFGTAKGEVRGVVSHTDLAVFPMIQIGYTWRL